MHKVITLNPLEILKYWPENVLIPDENTTVSLGIKKAENFYHCGMESMLVYKITFIKPMCWGRTKFKKLMFQI